jgi:predicted phosphodiesterase
VRIGLLSDVHANKPALQVALTSLRKAEIDKLLVAGDLVGYGAQPNECVTMLAEAGAHCVAGNHDLFVLDRLPATRFPTLARSSAEITRSLLSADVRSFLASLPLTLRVGNLLMAHGSPANPEEYVVKESRAFELLSQLTHLAPGTDTLVLGHTHRQWCVAASVGTLAAHDRVRPPVAPFLINPGSVGQSRVRERRPRVRFAIYDVTFAYVDFYQVNYDVESSARELDRLGLPRSCLHLPPRLREQMKRYLRRPLANLPSGVKSFLRRPPSDSPW